MGPSAKLLAALAAISIAGCTVGPATRQAPVVAAPPNRLAFIPGPQSAFDVDAAKPFHLEFGRGSGRDGLAMFILDEDGRATVGRLPTNPSTRSEQAQIELSPQLVGEVAADINSNGLTGLAKSYTGFVADGTQWAFLLTQNGHRKVIYCDNNFPTAITRFAKQIDDILKRAGIDGATWKPADRTMDANLWKAVDEAR